MSESAACPMPEFRIVSPRFPIHHPWVTPPSMRPSKINAAPWPTVSTTDRQDRGAICPGERYRTPHSDHGAPKNPVRVAFNYSQDHDQALEGEGPQPRRRHRDRGPRHGQPKIARPIRHAFPRAAFPPRPWPRYAPSGESFACTMTPTKATSPGGSQKNREGNQSLGAAKNAGRDLMHQIPQAASKFPGQAQV